MKSRALTKLSALIDSRLFWTLAIPGCALLGALKGGVRWTIFRGYAYERLGELEKAKKIYERAAAICSSSPKILELRWLHVVQFLLERAYHDTGSPREIDPLFECGIVPADTGQAKPVGYYKAEFVLMGMKIMGVIPGSGAESVEIRVDGALLRRVNVGKGLIPEFNFMVKRPSIELFPRKSTLTIVTDKGEPLAAFGGAVSLELTIPHGNGELPAILSGGGRLDKKGVISPSEAETRAHQDGYLKLYDAARDFFDKKIGKQLFLMYGTLLGFFREGDFIKGDDDFDAGYVSEETTPEAVLEETKRIVRELLRGGFTVTFNSRGRLFRIQHNDFGDASVHLDARPLWFQDGKVWAHNHFSALGVREDYLPVCEGKLRGVKIYHPARTETFLLNHYGPGWKVPDPGFTYYRNQIDPAILRNLSRALMKPDDYRAMAAEVEAERAGNPGMGRFISLAAMNLYPLSAFELDAD
jgi:tetratricopeptide (TPR) repeat protein